MSRKGIKEIEKLLDKNNIKDKDKFTYKEKILEIEKTCNITTFNNSITDLNKISPKVTKQLIKQLDVDISDSRVNEIIKDVSIDVNDVEPLAVERDNIRRAKDINDLNQVLIQIKRKGTKYEEHIVSEIEITTESKVQEVKTIEDMKDELQLKLKSIISKGLNRLGKLVSNKK